jgi:programmed cell death protein 5
MDEDKLDELKKKKMEQLQGSGQGVEDAQHMQEQQKEQMRQQLKQIASQILTKEAQSRLGNIRTAKPDLAAQIELQLVQLHRTGQIKDKITDDQLKRLLKQIQDADDDDRDIKYSAPGDR